MIDSFMIDGKRAAGRFDILLYFVGQWSAAHAAVHMIEETEVIVTDVSPARIAAR
jgi:hypothetical protein